MKRTMTMFLAFTMTLALAAGCTAPANQTTSMPSVPTAPAADPDPKTPTSKNLVVYTNSAEDVLNLVIPAFEAKYDITVELISGNTGELVNRMESEKDDPIADIMLGSGRSVLGTHLDLLDTYVSAEDSNVMDAAKNSDGYFSGYVVDSQVFLVNRDVVGDVEITGYEDLLNPALKGKIAVGNAAKSNSAYTHLVQMLDGYAIKEGGRHESESGWRYVEDLLKNSVLLESSGSIHKSVADGEYGVALTWENPAATYIKEGATNLEIVYPKECVYFNASAVQIIKNCKNRENAELFVDFLLSKEIQSQIGATTCARPVRTDVELGSHFTPYSEVERIVGRTFERDEDWEDAHRDELYEHFTDIMTSVVE